MSKDLSSIEFSVNDEKIVSFDNYNRGITHFKEPLQNLKWKNKNIFREDNYEIGNLSSNIIDFKIG